MLLRHPLEELVYLTLGPTCALFLLLLVCLRRMLLSGWTLHEAIVPNFSEALQKLLITTFVQRLDQIF